MITADMLAPIITSVTNDIGVLVPAGISILGIMVGVNLIPRIVYKFL